MSSVQEPHLHLEVGHILFLDIVGYSKLLAEEQKEVVEELNQIVRDTEQFRAAEAEGNLTRLPTGDGMALVFTSNPEAPVECALEISKALQSHPKLRVRMGIHSGAVNSFADVNDQSNLAGAGINVAQRVMYYADAGHILLSKHFAEDLQQYAHWRPHLHDIGEVMAKHGLRIPLVNLYTDQLGNSALPTKVRQARAARRLKYAAVAALLLITTLGVGFWMFHRAQEKSMKAAAATPEKSIAVLPFENLSADPENAFFADAVQNEILTNLAKVEDLKVISRTSVLTYGADAPRNLREIAQELGVSHVVEGSVQRVNEHVRVMTKLIDARTDLHVWAQTYDRELADIFAIQTEISQKIAGRLRVQLSPGERDALASRPTQDLKAFESYIRGSLLMETSPFSHSPYVDNLTNAVTFLEKAVTQDPTFALAYCKLSQANSHLSRVRRQQHQQLLSQAQMALDHAKRLAPDAGETHLAQALLYYYRDYNFEKALAELEIAERSLPNDAEVFLIRGLVERRLGRAGDSLRHFQHAIELNPKDPESYVDAILGAGALRWYPEANRIADAAIKALPAKADTFRIEKGVIALLIGDTEAARRQLEAIHDLDQGNGRLFAFAVPSFEHNYAAAEAALKRLPEHAWHSAGRQARFAVATNRVEQWRPVLSAALTRIEENDEEVSVLPLLYFALGDREKALRMAKEAVENCPVTRDAMTGTWHLHNLALIYAWRGDYDQAFETLSELVKLPWGASYGGLKLSPAWDNLRNDPRFDRLLAQAAKRL